MREIKFRGLDEKGKWHYGYFWVAAEGTHFIKERIAETHSADFKVRPETVGQYTGLKDKTRTPEHPNGKEIYKGDVAKFNKYNYEIYWKSEDACWSLTPICTLTNRYIPQTEVIGNIYKNPKLLNQEITDA